MYRIDVHTDSAGSDEAEGGGWPLLALLLGLSGLSAGLLAWQAYEPVAYRFGGITVDRLSASLTLLVSAVGAATYRFSLRYLDGEPGRAGFLRWMAFTVVCAYGLMLSTNLLLLFAAWSLTSLGLHRLLTFYPHRGEAIRSARKKFLISRLGDLALVGAIVVIERTWSTLDLHAFLAQATAGPETSGEARLVGLLVVLAAMTKSAQFPFHSWLPETMEAPTPVSALMHAGIINAGGALLLRFSPLIARDPGVLLLLVLVGTLTASLGMLAMWAQVKVKRTLAWSTVSQMGFMMVQCGLGVFAAAALHILGHGCYKARCFLRSGDLPPASGSYAAASPRRSLGLAGLGTVLSIPGLILGSWVTGFSPWHRPGELALTAIVALSFGQVWVALLGARASALKVLLALVSTLCASVALFAMYRGVEVFLHPVLGTFPPHSGPVAWGAAMVPVIAFTGLVVLHAFLPRLGYTAPGRALHVHALHGFYFGAIADRVVGQVWGRLTTKGAGRA